MTELETVVNEFREVLKQIFGILLDARQGFHHVMATTEAVQRKLLGDLPGVTTAILDERPYLYGWGFPQHHPEDPTAPWLHRTTHRELKQRNLPGGLNDVFIGNMCLVNLYTYWEDYYRAQLAKALAVEKDGVKVPVFGDIRIIRTSIVHHRAIGLPEVETCEVLKWFRQGDRIAVTTPQFGELAKEVSSYLDRLVNGQGTLDFGCTTCGDYTEIDRRPQ